MQVDIGGDFMGISRSDADLKMTRDFLKASVGDSTEDVGEPWGGDKYSLEGKF